MTWAADEASDRLAVEQTVFALKSFTSDFDGAAALARLTPVKPSVAISKEPMGEAVILLPGAVARAMPRKVRFITPDVAIVDATGAYPMLFIVKREEGIWRIASLRILAQ